MTMATFHLDVTWCQFNFVPPPLIVAGQCVFILFFILQKHAAANET